MNHYKYVEHILENYFAQGIGDTEEQALEALRSDMAESPGMAATLRNEVSKALADQTYSWRDALAASDVLYVQDETRARRYAQHLLGNL